MHDLHYCAIVFVLCVYAIVFVLCVYAIVFVLCVYAIVFVLCIALSLCVVYVICMCMYSRYTSSWDLMLFVNVYKPEFK